jgi:hypothetical protein
MSLAASMGKGASSSTHRSIDRYGAGVTWSPVIRISTMSALADRRLPRHLAIGGLPPTMVTLRD